MQDGSFHQWYHRRSYRWGSQEVNGMTWCKDCWDRTPKIPVADHLSKHQNIMPHHRASEYFPDFLARKRQRGFGGSGGSGAGGSFLSLSCCLPWFWEAVDGEGDEMDDGLGQSSQVLRHHRLQLGQKGDGFRGVGCWHGFHEGYINRINSDGSLGIVDNFHVPVLDGSLAWKVWDSNLGEDLESQQILFHFTLGHSLVV